MIKDCKLCSSATGTVEELMRIYESDDAPRLMKILTDTIATDESLHQTDRPVLAKMLHLMTSLMEEKQQEQKDEIAFLKKIA